MIGARVPRGVTRAALSTLVAVVVAALVAAGATVLASPSTAAGSTKGQVDPRIDSSACALLGRVWSQGVSVAPPHRRSTGCRIDACVDADAKIRPVTGQEVCYFGSQLDGPRYGAYVDSRVCAALQRRWIPQVNMCASNPFRTRALLGDARQCTGQASVYMTQRETEGYFDECVSEQRYEHLRDVAERTGRTLRFVATQRSRANCLLRPDRVFRSDQCVQRTGDRPPTDRVLITGESVMWRGHDELEQLRPSWSVDALPGRQLGDLTARVRHEWHTRGRPAYVIVGLGTNPTPGYDRADLASAITKLGKSARVMFVLPYRGSGTDNQLASVARYGRWERDLAKDSPGTRCIADFPGYVSDHPGVLGEDDIHPAPAMERTYARFLTRSWDTCLERLDPAPSARPVWYTPVVTTPTVLTGPALWGLSPSV